MGRESIDNHVVSTQSSMALLQERFRQLERMREIREERELLRKLSERPKQCNIHPTFYETPSSGLLLFNLFMSTPPRQVPNLSLWSDGSWYSHAATPSSSTLVSMETPLFALLPTVIGTPSSTSLHVGHDKFQDSECCDDVDTSLHL
ncbi:Carbohydrate-binding X8 domain superfamily protein [Hibiscus syriacus]|uniref:Carbohydrate-binding X8 domain superfamily protein n=1 Tax=Hibiscus syriacus TaxID=106335 RepID=A0A6A3AZN0_HIBSY|nr:Carbohydrate-binding X8 domain superfamily protein [Hibiscus syriacus]